MYERFTDRAQHVLALAQERARRLNHHHTGTDDLLAALTIERDGLAAKALETLGVSPQDLREHLEQVRGRGRVPAAEGPIPFAEDAKEALELAAQEAVHLGHPGYVGTEHILLGLLREEGLAARVLAQHRVNLSPASWRVQELLDQYQYGRRQAD